MTEVVVEAPVLPEVVVGLPGTLQVVLSDVGLPGPPGQPGPPGPSGGNVITWTPAVPLSVWPIPHPYDHPPGVRLLVGGQLVLTDVEHSDGLAVVTWAAPTSGVAILTA